MNIKRFLFLSAVVGLLFTSCGEETAFTDNPFYDEEATGEDPKIPAGGFNDTLGGGSGNGSSSSLVVDQVQRATVTYVGATWCPPCGANGDPAKIYMEDTYGDNVVILNVQYRDAISPRGSFAYNFGTKFQNFVGSNSIPHAYWSGSNFNLKHRGFYNDANANNSESQMDIDAILRNIPEVGVAAKATLNNGVVNVETKTKFYNGANQAYLGVYLLEDAVMAMQKVGTKDSLTSHENVMRASAFNSDTLGLDLIGTSLAVDEELVGNYQITVPGSIVDQNNLQVAVVVWESDQVDGISNSIIVDVE